MKYEQPYGVSDPNASYINGNPSTGTMGSIPPAASIENPQREIVNLIVDTGGSPTDTDLHQLGKGVQSGKLIYAEDFGIPNSYLINVVPALTAYAAGQGWNVKIKNSNTNVSVININSLGPRHIVLKDGQPLKGGEMLSGAIVKLVDDGTNLQLQDIGSIGAALMANKVYYVDAVLGDDTLYDGTTATVSAPHGPFRTIQRAITATQSWNMNGYSVTIFVADGVYGGFVCGALNGSGSCLIQGNNASPANVFINVATGEAIMIGASGWNIQGMKVATGGNGSGSHEGDGIRLFGGFAVAGIAYIEFGACAVAHMSVQSSATLILAGPGNGGDPNSFFVVSGPSPAHMRVFQSGFINIGAPKMTINGALSIGTWAQSLEGSVIDGTYGPAYTGAAGVTGQKYAASLNGIINTGGTGVNYFPGTIAGATATGGQYG